MGQVSSSEDAPTQLPTNVQTEASHPVTEEGTEPSASENLAPKMKHADIHGMAPEDEGGPGDSQDPS